MITRSFEHTLGKPATGPIPCRLLAQTGLLVLLIGSLYGHILAGLVSDWWNDANWSHGFIVPAFSAFVVWQKRRWLAATRRKPSWAGMVVIAAALGFLVAGVLGAEYFVSRVSLLMLVAGLVLYFLGWQYFREVAFAWMFLFFMIPLPAIMFNHITFPLQLEASRLAGSVLPLLGVPVLQEGNIIHLPQMSLEVAQACSGIRSLISLLMLGAICAYFLETNMVRRLIFVAAALPIAVMANSLRVVGTGVLVYFWSAKTADGFFHSFEGWLMFGFSLLMLFALHRAMRLVDRQRTRRRAC